MEGISLRIYQPQHPDGFASLETIEGEIVVPRKIELTSATIRFTGKASAQWVSSPLLGRRHLRKGTTKLIRQTHDVSLEALQTRVAEGQARRKIPFALTLPADLRQSFGAEDHTEDAPWMVEIYYYVRVRAYDDRGKLYKAKEYVAVRPDDDAIERAREAQQASTLTQASKTRTCDGSIQVTVGLSSRVVRPGETVSATIEVNNKSDEPIRSLSLKAVQSIELRASRKYRSPARSKKHSSVLGDLVLSPFQIAPHSTRVLTLSLRWPETARNPSHPDGFTCYCTVRCGPSCAEQPTNEPAPGMLGSACMSSAFSITHALEVCVERRRHSGLVHSFKAALGGVLCKRPSELEALTVSCVSVVVGAATEKKRRCQSVRRRQEASAGDDRDGVPGRKSPEFAEGKYHMRRHPRYQREMKNITGVPRDVDITPPTPEGSLRSFSFRRR